MSSKYIIEYLSDISDAVKGAKRVEQVNQSMASSLSAGYSNAVRVIGKNIDEIENRKIRFNKQDVDATIRKTGVAIQDTDGKFKQFNQTQTFVGDKLIKTKSSLKDVSGQFSKTEVETEKANKGFLSMGENIKRLVGRAALTIPVWIALRGTMQAVSKTMRDGAGALVDQDRAFQKAKRNIGGSASEIEANFNKLKKTAQEFSLKTGESVVNITTAFQRFKTTGLDYETSMAGALASTKTAVLLFGDTEQIANAVARSFRVLGGRTDEFGSKGAELESMLALIAELWKDNAFEIDEFANAIERLAPTAKNANVSLKESSVLISALHTAGIRGSRSTRLLSTAIIKMHKNFDQFGKVLGVNLKSTDSTFERLLLITDAIEKLHKADPVKASQAINDLFGIRAGESIKGLTALNSEIKKMIDISGD
ncbi:MAG: phage tail tape measure protein, partial [Acholeplasmataceae bacterium]